MIKQEAVWYRVGLAALFLMVFPFTSHALSAGGIGGRPANADPALPYSDSWFIYNLGPGESASDSIIVSNQSEEPVVVHIYAVDSTHTADGNFTLQQEDKPRLDVGSWVSLDESIISLPAGAEQSVPFTISIPKSVSVGEHSGGIIIQKTLDTLADVGAGGASILTRIGVRIYETVPGAIVRDVAISNFSLREEKGGTNKPHYEAVLALKNKSNVTLNVKTTFVISGWGKTEYLPRLVEGKGLFLDDLFDFYKGQEKPQESQLLRDQEVNVSDKIPKPRFGVFTVQAAVTYEGTDGSNVLLSEPKKIVVMPWLELCILGAILLILILSMVGSRLRLGTRSWRKYTVTSGDQLLELAHRSGVRWKKLMKVNSLKAPQITPGQTILLPSKFFTTSAATKQMAQSSEVLPATEATTTMEPPSAKDSPAPAVKKPRTTKPRKPRKTAPKRQKPTPETESNQTPPEATV